MKKENILHAVHVAGYATAITLALTLSARVTRLTTPAQRSNSTVDHIAMPTPKPVTHYPIGWSGATPQP